MIPACRIPPPSILRARRARPTNSADPASTAPTGADSPLLSAKQTESASATSSAAGISSATAALKIRAPSTCSASWCASHSSRSSFITAGGVIVPPARLWVFSTHSSLVCG